MRRASKASKGVATKPVPLARHPLRLWQRQRLPTGLRQDALLRLADIATDRADTPMVPQPRLEVWVNSIVVLSPKEWRRVAAGVAQGDGAALLALARSLLVAAGGNRSSNVADASLTALRLAHLHGSLQGNDAVRIVAAAELLLALDELIADGTMSRTRRGRAVAIQRMVHRSLGRATDWGPSMPELLSQVVVAWTQVAAVMAERGLADPSATSDTLSTMHGQLQVALDARAARAGGAGGEPANPAAGPATRRRPLPVRGRMVAEEEPPPPAYGLDEVGPTLVPHPGYDASRFGDNRTAMAKRYQVLGTPLPLVAAPGRAEAERAIERLAAEMPNFADLLDWVRDQLALLRRTPGRAGLRLPPVLLVGPPGVGKTRMCRRLAEALNLPFGWMSLAGSSDSRELSGTARGWSSAHPAWPLDQLAQLHCANPLLLLDEVDKAGGSDANGRAHHTLLTLLEPGTAARYSDECLGGPVDLSRINWVLTANTRDGLPAPLRSRVRVVEVAPPSPHQVGPVIQTILAELAVEHGVADARLLPGISPAILAELRSAYAQHLDPRRLRRGLMQALALAARQEEHEMDGMARLH